MLAELGAALDRIEAYGDARVVVVVVVVVVRGSGRTFATGADSAR